MIIFLILFFYLILGMFITSFFCLKCKGDNTLLVEEMWVGICGWIIWVPATALRNKGVIK